MSDNYEFEKERYEHAPVILDGDNPFERVIIDMVKMHRIKREQYSTEKDYWFNFKTIAADMDLTPLQVCEVLKGKHEAVIKKYWKEQVIVSAMNDAMIDRAVYSVIALALWSENLC